MSIRMDANLYSEVVRIEKGDFLLFHCEMLSEHTQDVKRYFIGGYYPRWHGFYLEEVREIIGKQGYTELKHFPAFPFDVYVKPNGDTYVTDDFQMGSVLVIGGPQNQRDDDTKRFKVVSVDDSRLRTRTGRLPPINSSSAANPNTMVSSRNGLRIAAEIPPEVVPILEALREAYVFHRGYGIPEIGIKAMGRPFRECSEDGKRYISLEGMRQLVRDSRAFGTTPSYQGIQLSQLRENDVAEAIFQAFPKEYNGKIDYDVFMEAIRGHMSEARKKAVWDVFQQLDFDNDGKVTIRDLQARFNAHEHPVVVHDGLFTADKLLKGFLTWWDENQHMYGIIPYSEWLDYYNGLSAVIEKDEVFLGIVQNTWKLGPWVPKKYKQGGDKVSVRLRGRLAMDTDVCARDLGYATAMLHEKNITNFFSLFYFFPIHFFRFFFFLLASTFFLKYPPSYLMKDWRSKGGGESDTEESGTVMFTSVLGSVIWILELSLCTCTRTPCHGGVTNKVQYLDSFSPISLSLFPPPPSSREQIINHNHHHNNHHNNILSIQSHVTHGYVGNKAGVFPLQLHGFDVDAINSVSLSNHSGYPVIKGHRMDLEEFNTIVDGLRANGFLVNYKYVLSGYINNAEIIATMNSLVQEINQLRQAAGKPKVTYLCDPVMGDEGKLYCKEEVISAYRNILAVADITTPNYFEASVLSGTEVVDLASAQKAASWFHQQGTRVVVIKSFPVPGDASKLQFLLSIQPAGGATEEYTGFVDYHEGRYTGTGDVFAATLLAFADTRPAPEAIGLAMGVLQDLLKKTRDEGGSGEVSLSSRELRVTHAVDILLNPATKVNVTRVKQKMKKNTLEGSEKEEENANPTPPEHLFVVMSEVMRIRNRPTGTHTHTQTHTQAKNKYLRIWLLLHWAALRQSVEAFHDFFPFTIGTPTSFSKEYINNNNNNNDSSVRTRTHHPARRPMADGGGGLTGQTCDENNNNTNNQLLTSPAFNLLANCQDKKIKYILQFNLQINGIGKKRGFYVTRYERIWVYYLLWIPPHSFRLSARGDRRQAPFFLPLLHIAGMRVRLHVVERNGEAALPPPAETEEMCWTSAACAAPTCSGGPTYEAVQAFLSSPSAELAYFPYPPCSTKHLRDIHSFLPLPPSSSTTTTAPTTRTETETERERERGADPSIKRTNYTICAVAGLVWVPLSGSPVRRGSATPSSGDGVGAAELPFHFRCSLPHTFPVTGAVEGYLQLLLVSPRYRRCGLARQLLDVCFRWRWAYDARAPISPGRSSPCSLLPPQEWIRNERSEKGSGGPSAGPRPPVALVQRWRLHTMRPTPSTLTYLFPYITAEIRREVLSFSRGPEAEAETAPAREAKAVKALLEATTRLYTSYGFCVRRQLYNYYDSVADAVELVCETSTLRPSTRKGHDSSSRKPSERGGSIWGGGQRPAGMTRFCLSPYPTSFCCLQFSWLPHYFTSFKRMAQ
eukprot:gene5871-4192_t